MNAEQKKVALENARETLIDKGYAVVETHEKLFITHQLSGNEKIANVVNGIANEQGIDVEVVVLDAHQFAGKCQSAYKLEKEFDGHFKYAGMRHDGQKCFSWISKEAIEQERASLVPLDIDTVRRALL